jgi:hypothetical protein
MTYQFLASINQSEPWIRHFRNQAQTTTQWRSRPESSVIILDDAIKKTGVYDAKKLQTISQIDNVSQQATAALEKEISEEVNPPTAKKASTKKQKTKKISRGVKKKAGALTKKTRDIFTQDLPKKRQKTK